MLKPTEDQLGVGWLVLLSFESRNRASVTISALLAPHRNYNPVGDALLFYPVTTALPIVPDHLHQGRRLIPTTCSPQ